MKFIVLSSIFLLFCLSSCGTQSSELLSKNPDGSVTLVRNTEESNSIYISSNGNVGIGKKSPTDRLEVNGHIHAQGVKVDLDQWADMVFRKEYNLTDLSQVEIYIEKNGHLPGIPSEETVLKKGIELGEMNRLLLQKIEELTLHLIDKDKKIEALRQSVYLLKTDVEGLKSKD